MRACKPITAEGSRAYKLQRVERREAEFKRLVAAGVPIKRFSDDRWQVGALNIWPRTGTWENTTTQQHGRIYGRSLREVVTMYGEAGLV